VFYLDLFGALGARNVRYVLVGGLALNLHGVERATMDIDLAVALERENLAAALAVAVDLDLVPVAPVPLEDAADPATLQRWRIEKNMIAFGLRPRVGHGPVVDLLTSLPVPFATLAANAVIRSVAGVAIAVASIDDLIAMKRAAGRPLDLSDIEALESIKRLGLHE
jgi:hypothetical protein